MAGSGRVRRRSRQQVEERVLALWTERIEEVAKALLERAVEGDARAQHELIDRVLGKGTDKRDAGDGEAVTLRIIIEDGEQQEAAAAPDAVSGGGGEVKG